MKEVENCTGKEKNGFNRFVNFWRKLFMALKEMWLEDLQQSTEIYSQFLQAFASNSKLIQNPGY
jgi:hypothetical protein